MQEKNEFKKASIKDLRLLAPVSLVFITGVVIVAVALFLGKNINDKVSVDSANCSTYEDGSILQRASNALEPSDMDKMTELNEVNQVIVNMEGYTQDINCVYPVAVYALYLGDVATAEKYYAELEPLYAQGEISEHYMHRETLEQLKLRLDSLKLAVEESNRNSLYFDPAETQQ